MKKYENMEKKKVGEKIQRADEVADTWFLKKGLMTRVRFLEWFSFGNWP